MYFILYILQILDKVSKKAWFEPGEKLHSLLNSTQIGFTCSFSCLLSGAEKNTHQKRKPRNSVCYCIYNPFTSTTLRLCENLAIDVMVYVEFGCIFHCLKRISVGKLYFLCYENHFKRDELVQTIATKCMCTYAYDDNDGIAQAKTQYVHTIYVCYSSQVSHASKKISKKTRKRYFNKKYS